VATETQQSAGRSDGRGQGSDDAADYAAINAVYLTLLVGLVAARHRRGWGDDDPIRGVELLPMGAASFALAKSVAREKIGTWVREPFADDARNDPKPAGRGLRRAVGELVTCTRCVGAWSALGIAGLRVASPQTGRLVTAVLATSAVNDFMQTGFRLLCEKTNATSRGGLQGS